MDGGREESSSVVVVDKGTRKVKSGLTILISPLDLNFNCIACRCLVCILESPLINGGQIVV